MDLREARERAGLSEKTLRRLIKAGRLDATLVGTGQHRHWEITEEALDALGKTEYGHTPRQEATHSMEEGAQDDGQGCPNCEWLKGQLESERENLVGLLREKDRQAEQLHVLLQQAQEQVHRMLPAPQPRRWRWPWG